MSYTTIQQCVRDHALQDRVSAGAMKEAHVGAPEFSESDFGKQLRDNPVLAINEFIWPVAIEYETAYEFALNSENPNPGGDPAVITDANIQASIQANWPGLPVIIPQVQDPSTLPPVG